MVVATNASLASYGSDDNNSKGGNNTIEASGGIGGSDGGNGGNAYNGDGLYIYKESGLGTIELLSSGKAKANFSAKNPGSVKFDLGSNPLEVESDLSLAVESTEPAAGTYYLISGTSKVYKSDGDGILGNFDTDERDQEEVTGISIKKGRTLNLELNSVGSGVNIDVKNDIVNHGAITADEVDALNMGYIDLGASSYLGKGTINTAGTKAGQNGGYLGIEAYAALLNSGDFSSNGADNDTGDAGDAGDIYFYADYSRMQNTGDLSANGGHSTTANGGDGGYVYLESYASQVFNSGDLSANGGNGVASGGDADYVELYTGYDGIWNKGNLSSNGGDASGGDAGDGDYVELYAYGPSGIYTSGDLSSTGGNTTDAAANAGDGGYVYVYTYDEYAYEASNDEWEAGSIEISGDILITGGNAVATGTGDGGEGGQVYIEQEGSDAVATLDPKSSPSIKLLGYKSATFKGGAGNHPGAGSDVDIENDYASLASDGDYVPGGSIINKVDFDLRGGDIAENVTGTVIYAAAGGDFAMYTDSEYAQPYVGEGIAEIMNYGDIDNSSGPALNATSATNNGDVWIYGMNGVTNKGDITNNGGADTGTDTATSGYGAGRGDIEMLSDQFVHSFGNLSANGGNGQYRGADAGDIDLAGGFGSIKASGKLSANGGNADSDLTGSTGGDAGDINVWSQNLDGRSINVKESYLVGTGETDGDEGHFFDGLSCSGDCN